MYVVCSVPGYYTNSNRQNCSKYNVTLKTSGTEQSTGSSWFNSNFRDHYSLHVTKIRVYTDN